VRPPVRLLAALAATVALVALTSLAASAEDDGPTYAVPTVGQCHALSLDDAMGEADRTPVVDCAQPHTSRVVAVAQLPATLSWSSPRVKLEKRAIALCQPAFVAAVGGGAKARNRSAYWWFWFTPTKGQRSHGARWISCELALLGGADLADLPTDEVPALSGAAPGEDVARCLTPQELEPTTCTSRHGYRATGTFAMSQKRFPGRRVVGRAAAARCPARVGTARYRWTFHDAKIWNTGDHTVVCYSRTRS
jgi:hypothetical protein